MDWRCQNLSRHCSSYHLVSSESQMISCIWRRDSTLTQIHSKMHSESEKKNWLRNFYTSVPWIVWFCILDLANADLICSSLVRFWKTFWILFLTTKNSLSPGMTFKPNLNQVELKLNQIGLGYVPHFETLFDHCDHIQERRKRSNNE